MATLKTTPKILLTVNCVTREVALDPALREIIENAEIGWGWDSLCDFADMEVFLDVDVAERAIAWLKEHGVEQER